MIKSQPAPPTQPSHAKKVLKVVAVFFGVLLLAGFAYLLVTVDLWRVHFGYGQAAARYRASGMPWTASDLQEPESVQKVVAGEQLLALAAEFKELKPGLPAARPDLLTPQAAKELSAYLAPRQKLLDAYRPLAQTPVTWNIDLDAGVWLLFPDFPHLKEMSRSFAARIELKAYQGDVQGSLDDLRLGGGLIRHLDSSEMLMGRLVSMANRTLTLHAVRRAASYHLDSPKTLEAYAKALSEMGLTPSLVPAIQADAYAGVSLVRNATWRNLVELAHSRSWSNELSRSPESLNRTGDPSSFICRSFAVPLLLYWAEFGERVKEKGSSHGSIHEIGKEMEAALDRQGGMSSHILHALAPANRTVAEAAMKADAEHLATIAVLRLAAIKARKGSFSREEYSSLTPDDPFTLQPMPASVKGDTIKVWSFGPDMTDQEGATRAETQGGPYDLTAELPYRSPSLTRRPHQVELGAFRIPSPEEREARGGPP